MQISAWPLSIMFLTSLFWLHFFFSFSEMPFSFVLRVKSLSKSLSSSRWFYRAHEEWKLNYHPGSSPLASGRCHHVPVLAVQNGKQERENWGNVAPVGPKAPFILNMEKNRSKIFFFLLFSPWLLSNSVHLKWSFIEWWYIRKKPR